MFTAKEYVLAESLEEAWQLNQKKTAKLVGGMVWLKMSHRNYQTLIDLSGLGLDRIEETADDVRIGCMVTLHQLETSQALRAAFGSCLADSVRHLVGIQFRNCATVGGSLFGRFGFSDVLTCLMALDAEVELYKAGWVSLSRFAQMPYDRDILVSVRVRKDGRRTVYESARNTATDFPVLTAALSLSEESLTAVVGARPGRAACWNQPLCRELWAAAEGRRRLCQEAADAFSYESNLRGSAAYRRHLAEGLLLRAAEQIYAECDKDEDMR